MNEMSEIYASLTKPAFAPQPEVFGIVWAVLYVLLAIATVLLFVRAVQAQVAGWMTGLLFVNLLANLLFTPLFTAFGLWVGLVDILIVLSTAVWLQVKTWSSARIVFLLLLPYTAWVGFATILQISLLLLN